MGRELSMDEEDLGYQGQHPDKERITYKSAGDGFLVYSVCDAASAYTYDFRPKMCILWDKRMGGVTPTFAAVLCLLQSLEGKWHHVFVDNLYGNLKLAEECSTSEDIVAIHHEAAAHSCISEVDFQGYRRRGGSTKGRKCVSADVA